MWLQPWFFSMRAEHMGHFLVFMSSQLAFSLSLPHFSSHVSSFLQSTGACASFLHLKQNVVPQLHFTVRTAVRATKALLQPVAGHHAMFFATDTKFFCPNSAHFAATSGAATASTTAEDTASPQPCAGQRAAMQPAPASATMADRKSPQQPLQNTCLQPMPKPTAAARSSQQMPHEKGAAAREEAPSVAMPAAASVRARSLRKDSHARSLFHLQCSSSRPAHSGGMDSSEATSACTRSCSRRTSSSRSMR
jgi:hypothetical protein